MTSLTLQHAYAAASALFFITAARHAVCPGAAVVGLLLGVGTTQMGVPLILGHVLLTWYLTGWFTPDMDSVTTTLYALCIVCYAVILIDMVLCHWRTIIPQPRFDGKTIHTTLPQGPYFSPLVRTLSVVAPRLMMLVGRMHTTRYNDIVFTNKQSQTPLHLDIVTSR